MQRDFILQIHLTNNCQNHCKHCYLGQDTIIELDFKILKETIIKFNDFINSLQKQYGIIINPVIHLTGGDPLLYKKFWRLLKFIKSLKIKVAILGNPDLITKRLVIRLKKHNVFAYQLSLDGLEKKHNYNRQRDCFKLLAPAVKILNEVSIKSYIMYNVTNDNVSDLLETYKLMKSWNVFKFVFARVVPIGNAVNFKMLNTELYKKAMTEIYKLYKTGEYTKLSFKEPLWALIKNEFGDIKPTNQLIQGCEAGISLFSIDYNGDIYPCRRLPMYLDTIYNANFNFEQIFFYNFMKELRKPISSLNKGCDNCDLIKHCKGCPAIAYFYHSDKDINCWKR